MKIPKTKTRAFAPFILACALLPRPLPAADNGEQLVFHSLQVKDGLPQISVLDIAQDRTGFMWFATRDGAARWDGYEFDVFKTEEADSCSLCDNYVTSLAPDDDGSMWIGTLNGLSRYDPRTHHFRNYFAARDGLGSNKFRRIYRDRNGTIWGCTNNGICRYDAAHDRFESFLVNPNGENRFECIVETATGDSLLLGHAEGVCSFNPRTGHLSELFHEHPRYNVRTLFKDRRGNIWIGTTNSGILVLDPQLRLQNHFLHNGKTNSLNNNFVRCIKEDRSGRILIGTFDGLNIYDPETRKFLSYRFGPDNESGELSFFSLHSICCDRSNTVWLGSYVGGVNYYTTDWEPFLRFDEPKCGNRPLIGIVGPMVEDETGIWIGMEGGGLLFFDPAERTYRQYTLSGPSRDFRSNIINSLYKRNGRLWVGLNNGCVLEFDPGRQQVIRTFSLPNASSIVTLYVDMDQYVYIGTFDEQGHGLVVISPDGHIQNRFTDDRGEEVCFRNICSIIGEEDGSVLLGSNVEGIYRYHIHTRKYEWSDLRISDFRTQETSINQLFQDRNGTVWAATMRHGLLQLNESLQITDRYSRADGLPSNTVCSVLEGEDGQIWISTLASVTAIDPATRVLRNWNSPEVNEFSIRSAVSAAGQLFFGGDRGLIQLDPEKNRQERNTQPPIIKNVYAGSEPLSEARSGFRHGAVLKLRHSQNTLAFEFRSLDYVETDQIRYAYRLEGLDDEWSTPSATTRVNYSNLPAGRYTFRIKAFKSPDDHQGCEGETVRFRILPPFWKSGWAIGCYIVLCIAAVYLWQRWFYLKIKLENDVRIKQQEQERAEKIHNERINMFTNFSHELRTPLTMIITPLEELLQNEKIAETIGTRLKLMHKNANRILLLVNQLLDFRKTESGHMKIRVAKGDFATFIEEIIVAFRELANSRNIRILYFPEAPEMYLWYDRSLMEKVLFNLLSNAVKNMPPEGGTITIRFRMPNSRQAELLIEDTGIGIDPDKLEHIFDPFYQSNVDNTTGTGIGLSLTKSIIDLHHGSISVTSQPGKGSCFRVILPTEEEAFPPEELIEDYHSSENIIRYEEGEDALPDADAAQPQPGKKHTILLADDNRDLRHYMHENLSGEYRIIEAADGNEAFSLTIARMPDLVVSDVMMPGRDGIQLCRALKNDLRTSHIPVILLTARSTILQIEDGLKIGADDYITKPFSMKLLKLRIANILQMRERLKELFSKQFNLSNVREEPVTSPDERFLQKLYAIMKEHLGDPGLNTDLFCSEIGMSRTNLYYKIKTLTNLSPTEFIRNSRLQIAAQLLAEKKIPIAEVSVMVGFNNHSYFSNCFKKVFGCSPSEYYNRNNKS